MVVGRSEVVNSSQPTEGTEECMDARRALDAGRNLGGIENTLPLIRLKNNLGLGYEDISIRTASQSVTIKRSGCTTDQRSEGIESRTVAIDCPEEPSSRCENCILQFEGGEVVLDALKQHFWEAMSKSQVDSLK